MKKIWYITIEGVGAYLNGSAKNYRWCTRVPDNAGTPSRYIEGMLVPSATGATIDPERGTSSFGSLTVQIRKGATARAQFERSRHTATTYLTAAASSSTGTLTVNSNAAIVANDIIWLNREAMRVVGKIGGATLTVSRAALSTTAQQHEIGTELFLTNPILYSRKVSLVSIDDDEVGQTEWAGRFEDIPAEADLSSLTLVFASDMALLDSYVGIGRLQTRAQVSSFVSFFVYDPNEQSLLDRMFERVNGGRPSEGQPAAVLEFDNKTFRCMQGNTAVGGLLLDAKYADWEKIDPSTTSIQAFEVLTSYQGYNIFHYYHPATASYIPTFNPVRIALILILSTGDLYNYSAGDTYRYDTLPRGYDDLSPGLGIPRTRVDLDTWEYYADISEGWYTNNVVIRLEKAGNVFKKLLWPLGLIITEGSDGTLTLVRLSDTASGDPNAISIDEQDCAFASVVPSRGLNRIFDVARIQFAEAKEDVVVLESTLRWYYGAGTQSYEVDAEFYDVEDSYRMVNAYAEQFARRMRFPPPIFRIRVTRTVAEQCAPGTKVLFSHPELSDSTGTKGLTNAGCYVVEKTVSYEEAESAELTLWYLAHDLARSGVIMWALEVSWYDVANKRIYIHERFDRNGDDVSFVSASQRLRLYNADMSLRSDFAAQTVEVVSVTSNSPFSYIVIDAHFEDSTNTDIYPQPNDLVCGVLYDNIDASESDTYHYIADSNATLGAANDDAFEFMGGNA